MHAVPKYIYTEIIMYLLMFFNLWAPANELSINFYKFCNEIILESYKLIDILKNIVIIILNILKSFKQLLISFIKFIVIFYSRFCPNIIAGPDIL